MPERHAVENGAFASGARRGAASFRRSFHLVLIKPSHYDDDGYVIQWHRSAVPSNTLAALYGLAADCADRRVLGEDVEIRITAQDETNTRIRPDRIARMLGKPGTGGLVCLVGVQSNQYPRAMDIARTLRHRGVPVAMGGFHVSGTIAMLPGIQPELQEALDIGVSLFVGEAEGRFDQVIRDAYEDRLKPIYEAEGDLPSLDGRPMPYLPPDLIRRTVGTQSSFDAGRGCPFQCSFCTIINVQGRKSRRRSADDVEAIVRRNYAAGIHSFFITDDNFSRNKDWESIFDRLIRLREVDGLEINFTIQVDTLCHKIDGFVEKADRAGVRKVFIGLENINPESLKGAKKRQNRLGEYRQMLLAWRAIGVITYAGYIIGFPGDTPQSIARDIRIIQRELPVDILEFFNLTPLPGSEDHRRLYDTGAWMEPDLNRYDLNHVTMRHPRMTAAAWMTAYRRAWDAYYAPAHVETLLRRARASGISVLRIVMMVFWFFGCIRYEGVHPLEGGVFRRRYRRDRRLGLAIENPLRFYPKRCAEIAWKATRFASLAARLACMLWRIAGPKRRRDYADIALAPVGEDEALTLELFAG